MLAKSGGSMIEVPINDTIIFLIKLHETVYVPIEPICDIMLIDVRLEQDRIRAHATLGEHWFVRPSHGFLQPMMYLPIKYFLGWLMSIDITSLALKVEENVIAQQEKVYDAIYGQIHINTRNYGK